jgi:cell wall assembly regulator SMI1
VRKFTRPLTREIEVAGRRLAVTLSQRGVSVRPVGSRKPPRELTWAEFVALLDDQPPPPTELQGADRMPRAEETTLPQPVTALKAVGTPDWLGRLDRWLAAHRPRYSAALRPGATATELARLKAKLERDVPPELAELLRWHNGQKSGHVGQLEQTWVFLTADRIAEAKRELDAEAEDTGWQREWIPILEDDQGGFLVLDGERVLAFWPGQGDPADVAPSLQAWIADFVAAVERGEYTEDPERGDFIRRK